MPVYRPLFTPKESIAESDHEEDKAFSKGLASFWIEVLGSLVTVNILRAGSAWK